MPRKTGDRSKNRGVSAIRRKNPKELSVSKLPLPEGDPHPKSQRPIEVDPNHGLWGFFRKDKKPLPTPEEDHKHGRAWTVPELRKKSWNDLHRLWWVCIKECNIMFTQKLERERLRPGYGDFEAMERQKEINRTQKAIKHVLTERYYSWQEARELAKEDPEIDLSGVGPVYTPFSYQASEQQTPEIHDTPSKSSAEEKPEPTPKPTQ